MTRHVTPAAAMFTGASGNTLVGDVYRRGGAAGAAAARRRPDAPRLEKTGELIARMGRVGLRGRPARPRRFRMGRRTAPISSRISPPTRACWPIRWRERSGVRPVAVGASLGGIAALLANGGAASGERVFGAGAGRHHAARRSRRRRQGPGLHARACYAKASARSRRPPTRSPPICRTGRGRARTRG